MKQKSLEGFIEEIYVHLGTPHSQFLAVSSGISFPDPRYMIHRKNSSLFSIEYVYEGSGIIHHGHDTYHVSAGDFFILHPNTYHHYYANPKTPWKKIFMTINGDPFFFNTLLKLYSIEDVCYLSKTHSCFQLENIFDLVKQDTPDIDHKLELLMLQLVIDISDFVHLQAQKSTDKITIAKNFIERRVSTKITVDEVSRFVSLDRSYFSRQFTKKFGYTPSDYITRTKIEYAKNLLKTNDMSIELIADKLSFHDTAHFSRKFLQYTGLTPSAYRRIQSGQARISSPTPHS